MPFICLKCGQPQEIVYGHEGLNYWTCPECGHINTYFVHVAGGGPHPDCKISGASGGNGWTQKPL